MAEEQQQRELLGLGGTGVSRGGNWRGSVPYLRLILCLTQDDIKFAFLRRADVHSCQESDARNSENRNGCAISLRCVALLFTCTNSCLYFVFTYRPLTVYELLSNLWNSETFNPIAPASLCHSDFALATDCSYEQVRGLQQATFRRLQTALRRCDPIF